MGSPYAFILAVLIVAVWAMTGPVFAYSQTWQLVINTGTTIVTFLMIFLVQNTQNRDSKAMQLKLDELIRSTSGARNVFFELDSLSDEELAALDEDFLKIGNSHSSKYLSEIHQKVVAEKSKRHGRLTDTLKKVVNR